MAVDNTSFFKAYVKTCRAKRKMIDNGSEKVNNILGSKGRSQFILKSIELKKQITQLRNVILDNRKAYLNFTPSFVNAQKMSDETRDEIDNNAQQIIKSSSYFVASLKADLKKYTIGTQIFENNKVILEMVENYLKVICKLVTGQMTLRVKWKSELQKIVKVDPYLKEEISEKSESPVVENPKEEDNVNKNVSYSPFGDNKSSVGEVLSEDEMQVFEEENELLFNDLNSLSKEVQTIQSKVVKIAELQEVFMVKILEQNKDLNRINTTIIGSTESVRDANKQIREAIQSHAGLRVYVLFFLLVMSFTLLFLDWYND